MKYLDYAHGVYQNLTYGIGLASNGRNTGDCSEFVRDRNFALGIVAFSDAPEPWQAMVVEYNSLRSQVITIIDPIDRICRSGGGTLSAETDKQILTLIDNAQNRMYQMLQQAKAMTK